MNNFIKIYNYLKSPKVRASVSSLTAIYYVGCNYTLGWSSPEAMLKASKVLLGYSIYDLLLGCNYIYTIHHLLGAYGSYFIINCINSGKYSDIQHIIWWTTFSEISSIFNGARIISRNTKQALFWKTMFAISFLAIRPTISVGSLYSVLNNSKGDKNITLPAISIFSILNTIWSIQILKMIRSVYNKKYS